MKPDEFFKLSSSIPPGLSSKSEFQLLIDDMKKYITTNVDFHQGDLLAHSAWTAFYVSDLFDIKSTTLSPLQTIYHEQLVKDFENEGLYSIDVKKVLVLAAFLHDIGKAGDGVLRYYDKLKHEKTGAMYLFENNYMSVLKNKIDLDLILKEFKITDLEKDIIICLIAGHWLIGDTMTSGTLDEGEYFVSEFIHIVYNFITDSELQNNIPFIALICMMQLIICVADVLASQEYKGKVKYIKEFPDIPLEHATHRGMDAYNKFNYDHIIKDFVPKVLTLINDGYFLKGTSSETTSEIVQRLIKNASYITLDEFNEAIGIINNNNDYNIDQISDILLEYIDKGKIEIVYLILYNFPKYISQLFDIIETYNEIPAFISYLLSMPSSPKVNTMIGDIIFTNKLNFVKELINSNYKFTPHFLGIAKNAYKKVSKEGDIDNEDNAKIIFDLIKNNYDFSGYYISDKHQLFCETLSPTLNEFPDALQITTTRVIFPYDQILEDNFDPQILVDFPSSKNSFIDITYDKDNYGGGLENTVDIDKGYQFHSQWVAKSINYIKSLSYRDMFTLYGYTHNGDELCNKYIIGNNQSYMDFVNEHIYDGNAFNRYSNKYFPLFFQVLDLIDKYPISKLILYDEDPQIIYDIKATNNFKRKYNILLNNIDIISISIIKEATKQYIEELDKIIKNAPPLTHEVVLYRGVKDKYYYTDPNNKIFINNTFMSTSYTIFNAFEFANTECCVKKIICRPGTPAIFLECITSHPKENEVLLGLNNKFEIIKDEIRSNVDNHHNFSEICENIKGKMNVTTMVTGVKRTNLKLF